MYTPPGYDQIANEKYPVLYIMHGVEKINVAGLLRAKPI